VSAAAVASPTSGVAASSTAVEASATDVTAAALMSNVGAASVIELRMVAGAAPMVFPRMVDYEGGIIAPSTPSI